MSKFSVNVRLPVFPAPGDIVSQVPPGGAVTNASAVTPNAAPEPPFVIVIACEAGFAPPTVAEADKVLTEVAMIPGSTVSVTGTTTLPFTAWGDEIVTFPL